MASAWSSAAFDDGEDDEAKTQEFPNQKDALILLIDARRCALSKNAKKESFFANALRVALQVMKHKIVARESDLIGVSFFGTKQAHNSNSFAGVFEMQELDFPQASRIRALEKLLASEADGFPAFDADVGFTAPDGDAPLYNALFACNSAFGRSKAKAQDACRIWLFTTDSDPCRRDAGLRDRALTKAQDLAEVGQTVTVWHPSKEARAQADAPDPSAPDFDQDAFFRDIVAPLRPGAGAGAGGVERAEGGGFCLCDDLEGMTDHMHRKMYAKRVISRVPFDLPGGVRLSVALYNTLYPAKKPSATMLRAATNTTLACETTWIDPTDGAELLDHQIKTYHMFGGERVSFTKDDVTEVKAVAEPGLVLLGFKPAARVRAALNMRSPYFVYPNEGEVAGSTTAFSALHAQMIAKDVAAIARFVPRMSTQPRLVALVAVEERLTEDGAVDQAPGMFAIPLPWADDIRSLHPPAPGVPATEDQVAKAKRAIKRLSLPSFSSRDFDNPALQKFYATLQALALDEEEVQWSAAEDDGLLPDEEGMSRAAVKEALAEFKASFAGGGGDGDGDDDAGDGFDGSFTAGKAAKPPKAVKRKAAGTGGAGKRAATGDGAAPAVDVKARHAAGQLAKCTIPQLKAFLKSQALPQGGKKGDLLARIEQCLAADDA